MLKSAAQVFIQNFARITVVVGLVGAFVTSANAADGNGADDFSLFLGHMLPNQIEGVTEILPVFGGRYGFGTTFGAIEVSGQNTHAMGVDFTTVGVTARADIPLSQGVLGAVYAGPALSYYTHKDSSTRITDYGLEVGGAGMMLVTESLWLRADLKFLGGPGTSLFLLFGLEFRTPGNQ